LVTGLRGAVGRSTTRWSEDRTPKGIGDTFAQRMAHSPTVARGQKTERRKALVTFSFKYIFIFFFPRGQKTERRKALVTK
jgi:hypothetical protein